MDYFTNDKPLVINGMISGNCNMSCKFCFGQFHSSQLTKKDKLFILDQIAKHKIPKLVLTGGEPLLDKDVIEILEKAYSNGIFTSLHTNGLLLTESFIQKIKKFVGRISLPLDGSSNYMNYLMRGEDNYFSKIEKLVDILKREQISFSIKTVASKKNLKDFGKMAEVMLNFQPKVWLITEFRPLRRGEKYQNKYQLDPNEFDSLKSELSGYPMNIGFFSNSSLSKHPHFFLNSIGEVYTNGLKSDYHIGNIFTDSIPVLWDNILEKNKVNQLYFDSAKLL
jgi:MoaA/NifB/PqqE/SkfB family radical SAM enzyme